jgi:hypothetical protein
VVAAQEEPEPLLVGRQQATAELGFKARHLQVLMVGLVLVAHLLLVITRVAAAQAQVHQTLLVQVVSVAVALVQLGLLPQQAGQQIQAVVVVDRGFLHQIMLSPAQAAPVS